MGLREGVKLLLGFGQRKKVTDFGRPQKMFIASLHLLKWMASAKTYFNAMILSYYHYRISCWFQASKSVLKPIRSLHKQALKILDR